MRMSRIFSSSACTIVAILAAVATVVGGFSPHMVGYRRMVGGIHKRSARPQLLHMSSSSDNNNEDEISTGNNNNNDDEELFNIGSVPQQEDDKTSDEEKETTAAADVINEELEDKVVAMVVDNDAVEEKAQEGETINEDADEKKTVVTEEIEMVEKEVDQGKIKEEEQTVEDDSRSETAAKTDDDEEDDGENEADSTIATDETDDAEDAEDDDGKSEVATIITDESAQKNDIVDTDTDGENSKENDIVTRNDNGDEEEEEEIIVQTDGSIPAVDEIEKGKDIEDTVVEPSIYFASPDDDDSDETIAETIKQSSEGSTTSTPPKGLDLELIANVAGGIAKDVSYVAGDIAKDVLSVLRFGAANFLTASLPENQRQDLLKRMGAAALPPAEEKVKEAATEMAALQIEEERASIQEEIALAKAEEAQKSEEKWEREKEEIMQEMEMAASARVENELKIQKMKLEEETTKSLLEKDQALQAEKERLEKAIQEEKEKLEALEDEKAAEVNNLFAVKTDEEIARNEELEALVEKRQTQQTVLESIEEELRASVANEEQQREQLEAMLEKRQTQQEELNTVEANLRVQVKAVEAEKARYQELVDGLKAMKENAIEPQQEAETSPRDSSSEDDEAADDESSDDVENEEEPDHPVLGPVVVDLGYKRIHLVSSGKLGTIPVWNRNRTYRNNRAKSMAAEKIKSMELGFPGVIGLHEASSGKLSIVDGQHRVGMMAALKETVNKRIEKGDSDDSYDDIFGKVLVEVYPQPESSVPADKDSYAEKVFLEINKAEPVKLIDMPGVASAADRQVITDAVEILQKQFGAMFSPSQRCRIPNVNVDNLRSTIFGANILKRHKLTTSKKLLEWLLEQNAALGDAYENDAKKQELVSKKQWTKASANNFYLGLESSWLYK